MTGHAALPPEDPTPPDGIPTPPTGLPAAPAESAQSAGGAGGAGGAGADEPTWPEPAGPTAPAEAVRTATPRRLHAVPDAYPTVVTGVRTGAFGRPIGKHRPTALHRLVEAARVLTGGLIVLTLGVVAAPVVLGAVGPGVGVMVGHVAGALVALAATGLAAWRRTPVWAATVAALVVPVDVLVVLALFWWR
ncbi:MAG TPA: hypothetical protein VGH76_20320 [Actinomycetospora sp.]|jgi:hypothetical protein|uniref:hypothetical protein n=1 Tax=Actinomycetospora sp. TaxID=1872135 RepID=UPI002F42FD99